MNWGSRANRGRWRGTIESSCARVYLTPLQLLYTADCRMSMSLVLRRLTRMRLGLRIQGISTIRSEMEAKYSEHGVVPDVIDVAPKETAKVYQ